ncbi:hypothetical protein Tco_0466210 [Tanacetum coccineum]
MERPIEVLMLSRMKIPYGKQSRPYLGATKNQRKCRRPFESSKLENFAASRSEGLDKTYDRFQKLMSELEIHGEVISQEYTNLKLLRSLPSAWNTHTLIMRNKSDLDTLSMDDLYNNLKVYEAEIKGGHAYHEGEEIHKEDMKESEFQWQINSNTRKKDPSHVPLMAHSSLGSSSSSSSDIEVHTCFKECLQSYQSLQKQYDQQREVLNKANLEIIDDFVFKTTVSETINVTSVPETKTSASKTSKESMEKSKIVRSSAPLIEEWESDSDDDCVIIPSFK